MLKMDFLFCLVWDFVASLVIVLLRYQYHNGNLEISLAIPK